MGTDEIDLNSSYQMGGPCCVRVRVFIYFLFYATIYWTNFIRFTTTQCIGKSALLFNRCSQIDENALMIER